jgi:hypothetical protein
MLIIHGEDQVESRKYFLELKPRITEVSTLVDLKEKLSTIPLFADNEKVFIENIFSRRTSNDKKEIVDFLETENPSNLIIWECRDVSAQIKKGEVKYFPYPKHIFKFLDTPNLKTFHESLKTEPVEMLFASLVTRTLKNKNQKWLDELLLIDYKQKTSTVPYNLIAALEFWLISINN